MRRVSIHSRRRIVQTMPRAHQAASPRSGRDAHDVEVDLLEGRRSIADVDDVRARRHQRPDEGRRDRGGVSAPTTSRCPVTPTARDARHGPAAARAASGAAGEARRRRRARRASRAVRPGSRRAADRRARTRPGRTAGRPRRGCAWRARSSGPRRSDSIASRTMNAASGSSAAVGSSRKTTDGSWSSARAIASFCFMPLLNVPATSSRRSHSSNRPQVPLDALARGRGVSPYSRAEEVEVRRRGQLVVQAGVSVRMPTRARTSSGSRRRRSRRPTRGPRSAR